MDKIRSIIEIKLKTSNCNIVIRDGHIGMWYFNWENNMIVAYTYLTYDIQNIGDIFEKTRTTANLALLVDILTLIANQDINTSVVISTDPIINSYIGNITNRSHSVDQFCAEVKGLKHQSNASSLNSNDSYRIDDSSVLHLPDEALQYIYLLLQEISVINKFSKELKKLINYWRKGVDLDHLYFTDESFLAFYKIIEYISKKANIRDKDIPKKYRKTKSIKMAYKIAVGANLKKPTDEQYQMLSDFVDIRNNWDIAHTKIRPLPNNDMSGLYYSYMDDVWDYHSHICQITRMILLREIGVSGISLINDGGLYKLVSKIN